MIVLDTHILIWWVSDSEKLPKKAQELIKAEMDRGLIFVSAISVWEIHLLVKKGRLKLAMDVDSFLEKIENLPFIQFIPVDNKIAAKSVNLPGQFHEDPADRMIIATARELGATLISSDQRIRQYPHVQSLKNQI